jgi:hypothetical protein
MTKRGYRTAIKTLGLSQVAAAKVLGIADRTSRAYALGERPVPEPVAIAATRPVVFNKTQTRQARRQALGDGSVPSEAFA